MDLLDPWISKLAEKGYNIGWAEAPVGRDRRNRVEIKGMLESMTKDESKDRHGLG